MELDFAPGKKTEQLVATVSGELDLYASVSFCNSVLKKMEEGSTRIVLDLQKLDYMDSSGVGALIRLVQKAKTMKGEIKVAGLCGTPKKVLEMSNIISLLKSYNDVEKALEAWT